MCNFWNCTLSHSVWLVGVSKSVMLLWYNLYAYIFQMLVYHQVYWILHNHVLVLLYGHYAIVMQSEVKCWFGWRHAVRSISLLAHTGGGAAGASGTTGINYRQKQCCLELSWQIYHWLFNVPHLKLSKLAYCLGAETSSSSMFCESFPKELSQMCWRLA